MKLLAKYHSIVDCEIGEGTVVRDYVNLYGCRIGRDCKIAAYVEVQRNVTIGDRCKIEALPSSQLELPSRTRSLSALA